MSDYISREALIGKVEKHYCAPCKGKAVTWTETGAVLA